MANPDHQVIRTFSHDVRNALAVIRANAQRLEIKLKHHDDPTIIPLVQKIDEKVDTIVSQIDEMYETLRVKRDS